MPNIKALYRISDGLIIEGIGPFEPSIPQIGNPLVNDSAYAIASFGDIDNYIEWPKTKRITGVIINNINQVRDTTEEELQSQNLLVQINQVSHQDNCLLDCLLDCLPSIVKEINTSGKMDKSTWKGRILKKMAVSKGGK